ncbi:MAG: metal-dependent transcriptional regulator [Calditrichia bacterium]
METVNLWKKFDESQLTHSGVHHLMAIYSLIRDRGYARGVDVAKYLNITRGSAFTTLKNLKEKGFITEDENKFYQLSRDGEQIINSVLNIRHVFIQFFRDVLNLSEKEAEEDACKIEHLISTKTAQQLLRFNGFFLNDSPKMNQIREDFKHFLYRCESSESCEVCEVECLFKSS